MESTPAISVCIPCYNGERFVSTTIESVLAQSFADFELIVVDDKSTDRTPVAVKGFSDSRIRFVQNEYNLGMGANWNKAMSCARGKYVKLMGQDDLLHPDCLLRQVQVLENQCNHQVALAVSNRNVIDAANRVILRRGFPFRTGVISGERLIRYCTRGGSNLVGEPVVGLFRTKALHKTGMCDPANPYMLDLSLWAELLKHGDAFIDPEYLASFRVSGTAASFNIGRHQAACFRQFVRGLRADSRYRPSLLDSWLGYALSFQWCVLRNLVLKFSSC